MRGDNRQNAVPISIILFWIRFCFMNGIVLFVFDLEFKARKTKIHQKSIHHQTKNNDHSKPVHSESLEIKQQSIIAELAIWLNGELVDCQLTAH